MPVDSFAQVSDLEARLLVPLTEAESPVVEQLLIDATAHLRTLIGAQVYPVAEVTVKRQLDQSHWTEAPGQPCTVTAVAYDGVAVEGWENVDGALYFPSHCWRSGFATITYDVGYAVCPPDLTAWACVLAAEALAALRDLGALTPGGVTSLAIDDFRKGWDPNATPGTGVPERVAARLRAAYGSSAFVTGSR